MPCQRCSQRRIDTCDSNTDCRQCREASIKCVPATKHNLNEAERQARSEAKAAKKHKNKSKKTQKTSQQTVSKPSPQLPPSPLPPTPPAQLPTSWTCWWDFDAKRTFFISDTGERTYNFPTSVPTKPVARPHGPHSQASFHPQPASPHLAFPVHVKREPSVPPFVTQTPLPTDTRIQHSQIPTNPANGLLPTGNSGLGLSRAPPTGPRYATIPLGVPPLRSHPSQMAPRSVKTPFKDVLDCMVNERTIELTKNHLRSVSPGRLQDLVGQVSPQTRMRASQLLGDAFCAEVLPFQFVPRAMEYSDPAAATGSKRKRADSPVFGRNIKNESVWQ
ncbi:hypothetical protein Slin15195_G105780 [Septoria linicola]|uniref:Uncharacterized protein n=1 Tax=Septoria linicola TaxID=215465 RepID=A0A9Q9AXK8_9PEZI|nr:hypothetical protein Slin15195_G105780 [Septoria linicola]